MILPPVKRRNELRQLTQDVKKKGKATNRTKKTIVETLLLKVITTAILGIILCILILYQVTLPLFYWVGDEDVNESNEKQEMNDTHTEDEKISPTTWLW